MLATLILAASVALQASAATIPIAVGRFGLTFQPNTIQVGQGDILEFRFWARNHSVVQGTWSQACIPTNDGGFFSGFFPTAEGGPNRNVFRVQVNTTDPIILYCSQNTGAHCKNGMVAVINPKGNLTLGSYLNLARNASTAVSPPQVFGGSVAQLPTTTSAEPGDTSTASGTTASATATVTATNGAAGLGVSLVGLAAAGAAALAFV